MGRGLLTSLDSIGPGALFALGLALAVLGGVLVVGRAPLPAAADGGWQTATCAPSLCSDPRDVALSPPGSGEAAAQAFAYLVSGAGRLWRSDDGGQSYREIQAYLDRELASVSTVRAAGAPTFTVYVAVSGTAEILRSRDEGVTFDSFPLQMAMQGGPICGLGPGEAVVMGNSSIAGPVAQWSQFETRADGLTTLGGLRRDCDIVRDASGNVVAVSVGDGRDIMIFSIDPNRPAPSRLVMTNTQAPPAWRLDDVDCESYTADEIIMGAEQRGTAANRPAVCRAAGRDQDDQGLLLSAPFPFTTWTTMFTTERPLISASFFDIFGALLRDDDRVYITLDGGSTWTSTPLPAGTTARRVVVVPRYVGFDNYPRVVVLARNGILFREMLAPPNVAISKEGPAEVTPGGVATYTLHITNTGASPAGNVIVDDTVSADHGVVSAAPTPFLRLWSTTMWLLGTLQGFETRTITYTVLLTDSLRLGDLVSNRAVVTATNDTNAVDNTSVMTSTVQGFGGGFPGFPDVQATKTGPQRVVAGEPFTYTLMAVNVGTERATDVTLVDVLPAQVRFLAADVPPSTVLTPTLRWGGELWPGSMLWPGEVFRIAVRVELSGSVSSGTVLTNTLNGTFHVTSTVASAAPPAAVSPPVSGTIGALGGTLSSQDGSSILVVPRRAFSSPVSLSFQPQTPPAATRDSIPLAAFSLSGTLGTASLESLDRPITVEVKYSDAGLTLEQERRLKLYRRTAAGAFVELPTHVDAANNVARATLDHLSDFVLQVLERMSLYLPFLARGWAGGW